MSTTPAIAVGAHQVRFLVWTGQGFLGHEGLGKLALQVHGLCATRYGTLAVGGSRATASAVAVHRDGTWTITPRTELPASTNGLWCCAANEDGAFVGGDTFDKLGRVLRFDGQTWHPEDMPSGFRAFRLCASERQVLALCQLHSSAVASRDASSGQWRLIATGAARAVADLWCDDENIVLVGDRGTVEHFDGASCRTHRIFPQATGLFVAGTSADDLFLVGHTTNALYGARFAGERWHDIFFEVPCRQRIVMGLVALGAGKAIAAGQESGCWLLDGQGARPLRLPSKGLVSTIGTAAC